VRGTCGTRRCGRTAQGREGTGRQRDSTPARQRHDSAAQRCRSNSGLTLCSPQLGHMKSPARGGLPPPPPPPPPRRGAATGASAASSAGLGALHLRHAVLRANCTKQNKEGETGPHPGHTHVHTQLLAASAQHSLCSLSTCVCACVCECERVRVRVSVAARNAPGNHRSCAPKHPSSHTPQQNTQVDGEATTSRRGSTYTHTHSGHVQSPGRPPLRPPRPRGAASARPSGRGV
jgi:hypothetical protein